MMEAIAFDYAGPRAPLMVVEARVDGRKVAVVIDSGAAGPFPVFVSQRMGRKLGLAMGPEVVPPAGFAVGGATPGYRAGRLREFSLGPVRLAAPAVAVTSVIDDLSTTIGRRIDAIVGATFLRPLVVAIDFPARRIDLAAAAGPAAAAQPLGFAAARPVLLVTTRVNGAGPFTMELDTGASVTSLSPATARQAGVAVTGQNLLTGAGGTISVGTGAARVTSAGVTRALPRVTITPAVDDIARTAGSPIGGILGLDWLQGSRIVLDGPGQRWWVTPG